MSKELPANTPLTEEQIRANTIGELKPLSGRILIVDYDPRWPELFMREADRIRAVLGCRALRIEHAGSTSVPGLAAKLVIDMFLEVRGSDLEAAGYVLRNRSKGRTPTSTCTFSRPVARKPAAY